MSYYIDNNDIRVKYTQILEFKDDNGIERIVLHIDKVFDRSEAHRCGYE